MSWVEVTQEFRSVGLTGTQILCDCPPQKLMGPIDIGSPRIDFRAEFGEADCPHLVLPDGIPGSDLASTVNLLMGKLMSFLCQNKNIAVTLYSTPHFFMPDSDEVKFFISICGDIIGCLTFAALQSVEFKIPVIGMPSYPEVELPKGAINKFLKAFKSVCKLLSIIMANPKDVLQALQTLEKRFEEVAKQFQSAVDLNKLCNNNFAKSILFKTKVVQTGQPSSFQIWGKQFKQMIKELRMAASILLQQHYRVILNLLQQFQATRKNWLAKAYMLTACLRQSGHFAGRISNWDLLKEQLSMFGKMSFPKYEQLLELRNDKTIDLFQKQKQKPELVTWDVLTEVVQRSFSYLLNSRSMWQQQVPILLKILGSSLTCITSCQLQKNTVLTNWTAKEYALLSVKKLLSGFELDLYRDQELPYVFYTASSLMRYYQRFNRPLVEYVCTSQPELRTAYNSKTISGKLKKRVGLHVFHTFFEHQYIVALKMYYESTFYVLAKLRVPRFDPQQQRLAYKQRMKFLSKQVCDYDNYLTALAEHQRVKLQQAFTVLKEAARQFKLLHSTDPDLLPWYVKKGVQLMSVLSVRMGMAALTMTKFTHLSASWSKEEGIYPAIVIDATADSQSKQPLQSPAPKEEQKKECKQCCKH